MHLQQRATLDQQFPLSTAAQQIEFVQTDPDVAVGVVYVGKGLSVAGRSTAVEDSVGGSHCHGVVAQLGKGLVQLQDVCFLRL